MDMKAHFLSVGCADCTLLELGKDFVMIDCGYQLSGENVVKRTNIHSYIQQNIGNNFIDLLILTHPHRDHYVGLEDIIGKYMVGQIWFSPYMRRDGDNSIGYEEWNDFFSIIDRLGVDKSRIYAATKGTKMPYGNSVIEVIGPNSDINNRETRECHDASLVVWVNTPNHKIIVCGDASDSELGEIRLNYKLDSCTILRASHHGSINGSNLEFIKAVSPNHTIISTESGVFESVPDDTALKRYKENTRGDIYRTDISGTLTANL